jgi:hypothetical protein
MAKLENNTVRHDGMAWTAGGDGSREEFLVTSGTECNDGILDNVPSWTAAISTKARNAAMVVGVARADMSAHDGGARVYREPRGVPGRLAIALATVVRE